MNFELVCKGIIKKPRSAVRFSRFLMQNFFLLSYVKLKNFFDETSEGKVSVITPTYNRLNKLLEAIESVEKQSYKNYEHIIISDGYDSNIKNEINKFTNNKIKYYWTYPLHVMSNYQRNYALKYANGEFVIYLDDDNVVYEKSFELMVNAFNSKDIGYVLAPIMYGDDKVMYPWYPFKFGEIDLLNYMIRREWVIKVWGQGMHGCADLFLIQKVAERTKGVSIKEIIGHHR